MRGSCARQKYAIFFFVIRPRAAAAGARNATSAEVSERTHDTTGLWQQQVHIESTTRPLLIDGVLMKCLGHRERPAEESR